MTPGVLVSRCRYVRTHPIMEDVVSINLSLCLTDRAQRAPGPNSEGNFERSLEKANALAPESVRYVKVHAVDVLKASDAALDFATLTKLLHRWKWITVLTVLDWPQGHQHLLDCLPCLGAIPSLRIANYGNPTLNLGRHGIVSQKVIVCDSPLLTLVLVGEHTEELRVSDCALFCNVRLSLMARTSSLAKLKLSHCPALSLRNLKTLTCLKEVEMYRCRALFPDSGNPLCTLPALEHLHFWDNACSQELVLSYLPTLRGVSVGKCENLRNIYLRHCPLMKRLTVRDCAAFISVLPPMRDMPTLAVVYFVDCPNLVHLRLEGLEGLEDVDVARTGLNFATVSGCPKLATLRLRKGGLLPDHACLLGGPFPNLTSLNLSGNKFVDLPVLEEEEDGGTCMPQLMLLDLGWNQLKHPLDLRVFPALQQVNLSHNVSPLLDRLGEPFKLHVIVDAARAPEVFSDGGVDVAVEMWNALRQAPAGEMERVEVDVKQEC